MGLMNVLKDLGVVKGHSKQFVGTFEVPLPFDDLPNIFPESLYSFKGYGSACQNKIVQKNATIYEFKVESLDGLDHYTFTNSEKEGISVCKLVCVDNNGNADRNFEQWKKYILDLFKK